MCGVFLIFRNKYFFNWLFFKLVWIVWIVIFLVGIIYVVFLDLIILIVIKKIGLICWNSNFFNLCNLFWCYVFEVVVCFVFELLE